MTSQAAKGTKCLVLWTRNTLQPHIVMRQMKCGIISPAVNHCFKWSQKL